MTSQNLVLIHDAAYPTAPPATIIAHAKATTPPVSKPPSGR